MPVLLLAATLGVATVALPPPSGTTAPLTLTGAVVSAGGEPLADATVLATCGGQLLERRSTDESGGFALRVEPLAACRRTTPEGDRVLIDVLVRADGFSSASRLVAADPAAWDAPGRLDVVLYPEGPAETVTVTAARRPLRGREGPASISVLSDRDLAETGALTLDEALRLTPGFTLFRRSSSRSANPTTQGVTLRGQSASGASRSLVLADGVPLNDPFGGWVYWNRVPRAAIDRVEVVRGGGSDMYGADAVGGVVQVFMVDPVGRAGRVLVEGGSQATARASGYLGGPVGGWRLLGAAERFDTDGFVPVSRADRGPVDEKAGVSTRALTVSLTSPMRRGVTATVRGGFFDEDRANGTPLQRNDTNDRQIAFDVAGRADETSWRVRAYALGRGYDQSFSAVAGDRRSEQLTQRQRVPSEVVALSAEAGRTSGAVAWLGGIDTRDTRAVLTETRFTTPAVQSATDGGRHRSVGFFGQASGALSRRVQVIAGLRADVLETRLDSRVESVDHTFVSPRASVLWQARPALTLRGSAYRAFRSPTLNERLRGFRVGNVQTRPNPALAPERSTGGEAAAIVSGARGSLAVTAFHTSLDEAITNVTVSQDPDLIVRERRNAGGIRASGVEVETSWHVRRTLSIRLSGTLTRAVFASSPEGLEGRRVPQVPRAQAAIDLRYVDPRLVTIAGQVRLTGGQWEDDRNTLRLDPATIVDLLVEREVIRYAGRPLRLFAAVENLFDAEYDVGRTPLRTVGAPRALRVGVRATWP